MVYAFFLWDLVYYKSVVLMFCCHLVAVVYKRMLQTIILAAPDFGQPSRFFYSQYFHIFEFENVLKICHASRPV
jgi:hypothetical protein